MRKHSLSKTNYLQFLSCAEELWLQKNRPNLIPKITEDALHKIEQGKLIDQLAKDWFKDGCVLNSENIPAANVVFQKKATHENMVAIADVIVLDATKKRHIRLFEVKASTDIKKEHFHDIAFQKMVFEAAGYVVTACYLVHVNKQYSFENNLDQCELLVIKEVTKEIKALKKETIENAQAAMDWIHGPMPKERITVGCPNKLSCPFVKHHFKNLPPVTIYDIPNISAKKLQAFMDIGVLNIHDVPADFPLTERQRKQVDLAQEDEIIVKRGSIKRALNKLEYPLYFIDYESFSYVIPVQDHYKPYQQMVFQYSLHIQEEAGSPIQHTEYILRDRKESVENLIAHMDQAMGNTGSVIVWNESFEKARNKEMADLHPAYASFLHSMNDRMFDLMVLFKKGFYSHPGFKGRNSLKSVLPVLCPDTTYKNLAIQNGAIAAIKWGLATSEKVSKKEANQIFNHLLKYCHLDTLAMVKILAKIRNTIL